MLSICRGALGNLVALALAMGCSSGGGDGDKTVVDAEVRQILDAEVDARPPLDLGIVEECAADETRPCGFDLGVCRAGIQRCVQGLWSVDCEGVVGPVDERCDGIDNDCDESTDEGFALGGACKYDDERGIPQDGVTACDFASGGLTCIAGMDCSTDADGDGANICMDCDDDDRRSYPQAIELCDGADNDCDGRDDEIFDFESICYVGEGVCRRGGEPVCAANGELGCDATPGEPEGEERCGDAEDDDCDGQVDEGFEVGAACMAGIGACRVEGIIDCARDGVGVACDAVARAPEAERCGNQVDDDCDGATDEGFALGGECVVGEGACERRGNFFCDGPTGEARCSADAAVPRLELCGNQMDDDCDGTTDEGFDLGAACGVGLGECARAGVRVCAPNGQATVCNVNPGPPGDEFCGSMTDEDCDGITDEGFDAGQPCSAGLGECRRLGIFECAPNRLGTLCTAQPGDASPETCNDLDDDCDGTTDEGFDVGGNCQVGVGACRREGQVACDANGGLFCRAQLVPPGQERCGNGLDDDCDGRLDEGFDVGSSCNVGVGGCARSGALVCAFDQLRTTCDVDPGQPVVEVCGNRVDDDCDATVDEGFDVNSACQVGVGACRRNGFRVCNPNGPGTICGIEPGLPRNELCGTAEDEDCDTRIDEGFDVGAACQVGRGECFRRGQRVCSIDGAATTCNAQEGAPAAERCDTLDNDCDGRNDEGFTLGLACTVGNGPCRNEGVQVCRADGATTVCDAQPRPGEAERCDERDNDCDNRVDEDFQNDLDGPCDANDDQDLCENGYFVCNAVTGGLACMDDRPSPEVCDYQDNDCDGVADNGIDLLGDEQNCGACGEVCPEPFGRCRQGICYREYWVDAVGGSNANGTGARDNPWRTIRHATGRVLGPRAAIMVLPGTYSAEMDPVEFERFPIPIPDGVEISGFGDIAQTIVDPAHRQSAFTYSGAVDLANLLERLTINRGGINGGDFGAIRVQNSNATLRELTITNSRGRFAAAALLVDGGSVVVDDCTFTDNVSQGVGVIVDVAAGGRLQIFRSQFRRNTAGTAPDDEGVIQSTLSTLEIYNTTIAESTGNAVMADFRGAQVIMHNNTIANNAGTGLFLHDQTAARVANNVFANNGMYGLYELGASSDPPYLRNNLFWQNTLGAYVDEGPAVGNPAANRILNTANAINALGGAANNVVADPRFFSLPAGNFRLTAGSAAIDAADATYAPATDYDGRPRPRGNADDIGAFEF
jgi:hypothetical protein